MADIAREAGVSVFTVSCALRGRRGVSEATARRVRALAERLGYQMDGAARLLAMRRRRVRSPASAPAIALWRLGPDTHAERLRHMDEHLAAYARTRGFLLHCTRSDDFPSLPEMGRALYARGIEGLILVANALPQDVSLAEWQAFPWHRFSLVKVSRGAAALRCPVVAADPSEMMRGALERACAAGAQRILVLLVRATASPRDDFDRWGTVAAFRALRATEQHIELADFDSIESTPTSVLRDLIGQSQPDMIIGFPAGWILALEQAGYRVPNDFGFIGLSIPRFEAGPLARVTGYVEDFVGLEFPAALHLLEEEIAASRRGFPPLPAEYILPPEWQEGETGVVPTRARRAVAKKTHGACGQRTGRTASASLLRRAREG